MVKNFVSAIQASSTVTTNAYNAQQDPMSPLMENLVSATRPTKSTMINPTLAKTDASKTRNGIQTNVSASQTIVIGIKDVENVQMDQLLVPTNLSAFAIMLLLTLTLRSTLVLSVHLGLFLTEIEVDVLAQMDST